MSQYHDLKVQIRVLDAELEAMAGENKVDIKKERRLAALLFDLARAKSAHAEQMKRALRRRFAPHSRYVEHYIQEGQWDRGGEDYWAEFETEDRLFDDFKVYMRTLIDVEVS